VQDVIFLLAKPLPDIAEAFNRPGTAESGPDYTKLFNTLVIFFIGVNRAPTLPKKVHFHPERRILPAALQIPVMEH
jgi:hypothetical protein